MNVYAEHIRNGTKRHACSARLWFVAICVPSRISLYNILRNGKKTKNIVELIEMPEMSHYPLNGPNCESEGASRYLEQKQRRERENEFSQLIRNFELTEWVDRSLSAREYDQQRSSSTVSILSRVEFLFNSRKFKKILQFCDILIY